MKNSEVLEIFPTEWGISLKGKLTELLDVKAFVTAIEQAPGKDCVFLSLGLMTRANSSGLALFADSLKAISRPVQLTELPIFFVHVLNMTHILPKNTQVASFYAPFSIDGHTIEQKLLIVGEDVTKTGNLCLDRLRERFPDWSPDFDQEEFLHFLAAGKA
jgi:hypothetical protein